MFLISSDLCSSLSSYWFHDRFIQDEPLPIQVPNIHDTHSLLLFIKFMLLIIISIPTFILQVTLFGIPSFCLLRLASVPIYFIEASTFSAHDAFSLCGTSSAPEAKLFVFSEVFQAHGSGASGKESTCRCRRHKK